MIFFFIYYYILPISRSVRFGIGIVWETLIYKLAIGLLISLPLVLKKGLISQMKNILLY